METYRTLQELTGHEAGAVQYADGAIWVGNWSDIVGVPRGFAGATIGLRETMTAKRTATPANVKRAMVQHERDQGDEPSKSGWRAWEVTAGSETFTVVINRGWN